MNASKQWEPFEIDSFKELCGREEEILKRLAATENGGYLFILNPLMLLTDLGVKLSSKAEKELLEREPALKGLGTRPYQALKSSSSKQVINVNVKSLFRRDKP